GIGMDENKRAALASALEQIKKLPKSEVKQDVPFTPNYRANRIERLGHYNPCDYLPYRAPK
ncbi:MAG: hypothetical protein ACRCUU_02170, partial [Plesiomonas sp.]